MVFPIHSLFILGIVFLFQPKLFFGANKTLVVFCSQVAFFYTDFQFLIF